MQLKANSVGIMLVSFVTTFLSVALPIPQFWPQQSVTQQQVWSRALAHAQVASARAESDVSVLVGSDATRTWLKRLDDGSALYLLSTSELSTRLWAALENAELVHSFGDGVSSATANCGFDMTVEIGQETDEFFNQWILQANGKIPVDEANNVFTEWSETKLFGLPPFQNVSDPDVRTARDRPVYTALNVFRGSGGNPQCGPVTALISRGFVQEKVLAAPVDTGLFRSMCGDGQETGMFGGVKMPLCRAWLLTNKTNDRSNSTSFARALGVPPHIKHLLRPFLIYYNHTQAAFGVDEYVHVNLARLLIRLLSPNTYQAPERALRLNFVENMFGYLEHNPLLQAYPTVQVGGGGAVKAMIAMYSLLWGSREGERLREWCVQRGWPLMWAFNPSMSYFRCGPRADAPGCTFPKDFSADADAANIRLLDPVVLGKLGLNVSTTDELLEDWNMSWALGRSKNRTAVSSAWHQLSKMHFERLAAEPLYPGACASEPQCVGVLVVQRTCVCRSLETWTNMMQSI